jgi:hypothetical protein
MSDDKKTPLERIEDLGKAAAALAAIPPITPAAAAVAVIAAVVSHATADKDSKPKDGA